jgi:hypothetical protein
MDEDASISSLHISLLTFRLHCFRFCQPSKISQTSHINQEEKLLMTNLERRNWEVLLLEEEDDRARPFIRAPV